jgi:hypothetical protein
VPKLKDIADWCATALGFWTTVLLPIGTVAWGMLKGMPAIEGLCWGSWTLLGLMLLITVIEHLANALDRGLVVTPVNNPPSCSWVMQTASGVNRMHITGALTLTHKGNRGALHITELRLTKGLFFWGSYGTLGGWAGVDPGRTAQYSFTFDLSKILKRPGHGFWAKLIATDNFGSRYPLKVYFFYSDPGRT